MRAILLAATSFLTLAAQPAHARMVCTVVADARSGAILHEEGDCRSRVTPASTFKVPLAVMGYDTGFLADASSPQLPFKKGYADWGGSNWTQATTPQRWMTYSVVWYSQEIARALGAEKLTSYASAFEYGNADFAGDPGKDNALERAWISSSLKIAPVEQVAFLRKLVNRQLPVDERAVEHTMQIVESTTTDGGWTIHGKTGSAYPRQADGTLDRTHGWGWFVGWATQGDTSLVFARLDQDEQRHKKSGGLRAREAFLKAWPDLSVSLRKN